MPLSIVVLILGLVAIRTLGRRGRPHSRHGSEREPSDGRLARLEAQLTDLQEQVEQDRLQIARLREERDFLRRLYPDAAPTA